MVRLMSLPFLAAILTLVLSGIEVRGEMTHWTYNSYPSQPVFADLSGNNDRNNPRGISMSGDSSGFGDYSGSAKVELVSMFTYNFRRSQDGPATFAFDNSVPFTITMSVHDKASQQSGQLAFNLAFDPRRIVNGAQTGYAYEGNGQSSLSVSFIGPTTQSLALGANQYSVSLIAPNPLLYWNADPSRLGFTGSIDAQVNVSPANAAATPEPSCQVLAGMGLVTVAGAGWRRRRRQMVS